MIVYAADNTNLYNTEPAQTVTTSTSPVTNSNLWNLDLGILVDIGNQLKPFIVSLNYFVLGWCIFYSVLSLASFYFIQYYMDGEISREKLGTEYIMRATTYWWGYLICWIFFFLYQFFPALGIFVVGVYLFKLVFADMHMVLDLPDDDYDLSSIITNYRNLVRPIRKSLRLQFGNKAKKK
jgi:hypothetical protein